MVGQATAAPSSTADLSTTVARSDTVPGSPWARAKVTPASKASAEKSGRGPGQRPCAARPRRPAGRGLPPELLRRRCRSWFWSSCRDRFKRRAIRATIGSSSAARCSSKRSSAGEMLDASSASPPSSSDVLVFGRRGVGGRRSSDGGPRPRGHGVGGYVVGAVSRPDAGEQLFDAAESQSQVVRVGRVRLVIRVLSRRRRPRDRQRRRNPLPFRRCRGLKGRQIDDRARRPRCPS